MSDQFDQLELEQVEVQRRVRIEDLLFSSATRVSVSVPRQQ